MEDRIVCLLLGVGLYLMYPLFNTRVSLMRLCVGITNSQATALVVIGEVVTLLPFASIIWRRWNVSAAKELLALSSLGFSEGYYHAASTYCSQNMKLGISFNDLVYGGKWKKIWIKSSARVSSNHFYFTVGWTVRYSIVGPTVCWHNGWKRFVFLALWVFEHNFPS